MPRLWLLPDVLFYLGLGVQVEGVSGQQSDPLLLPAGAVLLLLLQHLGEALCGNMGTHSLTFRHL